MVDKTHYILSKFPNCSPNMKGTINTHCPFHDDVRPSFSIDIEEGLFICGSKSCGIRGNFPLFYKLMENIDSWKQVWDDLKEKSTNFNINDVFKSADYTKELEISEFPPDSLLEPLAQVDYLLNRGIGQDVIDKFGLKYGIYGKATGISITGSIVCPVWDIDGRYMTFQVRYLKPDASMRWCNPSGSPIQHLLYGGWLVSSDKNTLWLVEGASDVWRLASYGIQAVGLNTKEASPSQLNKITKLCKYMNLTPVVCMDGDAQEANEKLFNEVEALGFDAVLIKLDYEEDPGGLQYSRVVELWRDAVGN